MREDSLTELADSIKAQGVIQPIVVRPVGASAPGEPQRYEIVAGERRWRAAQMAGLHDVPAVLRRIDDFVDEPMVKAVAERGRRAAMVLRLDDAVAKVVAALKARGMTSPYLKAFVIARVNPIRFSKATAFDFDEVLAKMTGAAERFKVDRVRQEDVARAAGGPPDED